MSDVATFDGFTFHYVSIKSSVMEQLNVQIHIFTFHYVSIKSWRLNNEVQVSQKFTFHYVSIKNRHVEA